MTKFLWMISVVGLVSLPLYTQPSHPNAVQSFCNTQSPTPRIISANIVSPPAVTEQGTAPQGWSASAGRLSYKGIQYVSGGNLQLELFTSNCTEIQEIHVGSTVMTPAKSYSGTQPYFYWYDSIDTQNNLLGHRFLITIGFPAFLIDGSSDDVSIIVRHIGGTATDIYAFPMVHVKLVLPANADSPVGFSDTFIHNQFANGLYTKFNGPRNSVTINHNHIYGYDPASLGTYIDSVGIWFNFKFKVDQACNPTVKVTGTFDVDTNAPGKAGLSVRWANPVVANADIGWCDLAAGLLQGLAYVSTAGIVPAPGDSTGALNSELTTDIQNSLNSTNNPILFLDGTITSWGELRVNLKLPAPAVEIQVPYDAFDMGKTGMHLPPGQSITLIASGIGMRDQIATTDALLSSGPDGVPLHSGNTVPGVYSVARSGALLDNSAQVGQIMARITSNPITSAGMQTFDYTPGCVLKAPGASPLNRTPRIQFGINDTPSDAQRLRANVGQGYSLRVLFGLPGSPCGGPSNRPTNR